MVKNPPLTILAVPSDFPEPQGATYREPRFGITELRRRVYKPLRWLSRGGREDG